MNFDGAFKIDNEIMKSDNNESDNNESDNNESDNNESNNNESNNNESDNNESEILEFLLFLAIIGFFGIIILTTIISKHYKDYHLHEMQKLKYLSEIYSND